MSSFIHKDFYGIKLKTAVIRLRRETEEKKVFAKIIYKKCTFKNISKMSDSSDSESSSSDLQLPPELLERERQLWERNQQLQNRVQHILQSTDAALGESSSFEIKEQPQQIEKTPVAKSTKKTRISTTKQSLIPKETTKTPVRETIGSTRNEKSNIPLSSRRKRLPEQELIEVEVPQNVEPVVEVKYDPVPELRETLHKIAIEIENVQRQISEAKSAKTKAEVQVSHLQAELKKLQIENQNINDDITIMSGQIEEAKERKTKLKTDIEGARLSRIEKFQQQNELAKNKTAIEAKVRKQRALATQLQNQYSQMPQSDGLLQKLHTERQKRQTKIENEKKSLRSAKLLLNEIEKACQQEQKIYEHIMLAKTSIAGSSPTALSSDAIRKAIREFIPL